jgi:hypothetical protein
LVLLLPTLNPIGRRVRTLVRSILIVRRLLYYFSPTESVLIAVALSSILIVTSTR